VFYRPVFSGDGRFFTYSRQRKAGVTELVRQSFDGGPEEVLLSAEGDLTGGDESADGKRLLFMVLTGGLGAGLEELTLPARSRRRILAASAGEEIFDARYQPGGEWIAYNARGRAAFGALGEVFVCRADGSERTQVSAGGGTEPRWRGDGRELFHWNGKDELVANDVTADGDRIEVGPPRVLFQAPRFLYNSSYGVAPDGQRFLITVRPPLRPTSAYVMLDWLPRRPGS
jgi:Tol biopolymer transport system component